MCRRIFTILCFALLMGLFCTGTAYSARIGGATVTATASAEEPFDKSENRVAINTVNGSGMDETFTYHDDGLGNMWLAGNGRDVIHDDNLPSDGLENPNPGTLSGIQWLRLEMEHVFDLDSIWVWNYNQSGSPARGLKDVTIQYSTTGGTASGEWSTLGSYEFTEASGFDNYAGFEVPSFSSVSAKYVVITAHTVDGNWGGNGGSSDPNIYYGLSEVALFGTTTYAYNPTPDQNAPFVERNLSYKVDLSWEAGTGATAHDVYIGTDEAEVAAATRAAPGTVTVTENNPTASLETAFVDAPVTFYWRVDETVAGSPINTGNVWKFRTASDTLLVEDFEGGSNGALVSSLSAWSNKGGTDSIRLSDTTPLTSIAVGGGEGDHSDTQDWVRADMLATDPDTYFGYIKYTADMNASNGTDSRNCGAGLTKDGLSSGPAIWYNGGAYGWGLDARSLTGLVDTDSTWNDYYVPMAAPDIATDEPVSVTMIIDFVEMSVSATIDYSGGTLEAEVVLPELTANMEDVDGAFIFQDMVGRDPNAWQGLDVDNIVVERGRYLVAKKPSPKNKATGVDIVSSAFDTELTWLAGVAATAHDVYMGTDETEVTNATRASHTTMVGYSQEQAGLSYVASPMELTKTYYWRVDEVNDAGLPQWKGTIWQFTMADNVIPFVKSWNITATSGPPPLYQTSANDTIDGTGMDTTDRYHTNEYLDMWISSATGSRSYNAGTAAGPSWIAYVFNKIYNLDKIYVWNYNEYHPSDGTELGMKNVSIQYSTTGGAATSEWTTLTPTLAQSPSPASGWNKKMGDESNNAYYDPAKMERTDSIDLGGASMKYVVITPNSGLGNGWWGPLTWYVGLSEVRFLYPVAFASFGLPTQGAIDQPLDVVLSWTPGEGSIVQHKVYIGTDPEALGSPVATLDVGTTEFDPNDPLDDSQELLDWDTTYYWRIDEVNTAAGVTTGILWRFTTYEGMIIDNYEVGGAESFSWSISANGTAEVNDSTDHAIDTQSMKFSYNNSAGANYSEVRAPSGLLPVGEDWTQVGVTSLSLKFMGSIDNDLEPLYFALDSGSGAKVIEYDGSSINIASTGWTEWVIDLADFTTLGVDLASIDYAYIGVGDSVSPSVGGEGTLYIDDIALYPPRCVYAKDHPDGDIAGEDCFVNSADIDEISEVWLLEEPTSGLIAHYTFDADNANNSGSAGSAANGSLAGGASIVDEAGMGKVLKLTGPDGGDDYMNCGGAGGGSWSDTNDFTIAMWLKAEFDQLAVEWWAVGGKTSTADYPAAANTWYFEGNYNTRTEFKTYGGGPQPTGTDVRFELPNDQKWHHVVLVSSDIETSTYIDGKLGSSKAAKLPRTYCTDDTWFGAIKRWEDEGFIGLMDDIRVYDRVLSLGEVKILAGSKADMNNDQKINFEDYAILTLDYLKDPILWP